ncbi:unnamed protein product [Leptosia nina]|uniref:Chemosensory protein n=1 Tax=Leptosia nina TaxID=320188 RepID=A0AAV1JSP4_9NEOP
MKLVIILIVCLACAYARPETSDTYTDKYDGIELDDILSNRRLFLPYVQCILEKGKCSPEGRELKSHIKEALENFCDKCTEAQKRGTQKVISYLVNNETEYWNQLVAKYDPNRKYVTKYEKELRSIKA